MPQCEASHQLLASEAFLLFVGAQICPEVGCQASLEEQMVNARLVGNQHIFS